jgi:vitamin B12 transporter
MLTFAATPVVFLLFLFQIRTTVVDPSGRPVEGAEVSCGAEKTSTNSAGEFEVASACEARIAKPGFAARTVTVSEPSGRIELALSAQSDRVTVSATGAPVALEEAGVSATVFTAQDFEPSRGAFVQNLLRDVPGLNVVQTGQNGGIVSLFVRGGGSSSTQVLLDGVPLTEPGGYYDFVHLMSAGLERMEVVRGPESALFGAEAASGAIQLFTKHGDVESARPHGTLVYERGSFSTDHWTASMDGGLLRKFDYAFTADQYRSTGEFPNDAYRVISGTANVGYAFTDSTRLRAVLRTMDSYTGDSGQTLYGLYDLGANNRDRDAGVSVWLDDARGKRYVEKFLVAYHRYRDTFSDATTDSYDIRGLLDTRPNGDVFFVKLLPVTPAVPGSKEEQETLYPFPSATYTNRTAVEYQGTLTHKRGALVVGYEYERQAGTISLTDVDRSNNGFFAQEQFALSPRIFLTGGARVEHSSTFGTEFTPRGSATFRLPTDTYLRFSASRGIREPALYDNFAHESYYVGNPLLRPEKTTAIEAGLSHDWVHGRVRTEASYFRNYFTDLIQFDFSNFPGTSINIDRSRAHGFEASGSAKVVKDVTLRASYTLLYTKITKSSNGQYGMELARRPKNSGAMSLDWSPRQWSFLMGARIVGERADNDFVFGVNRNPGYEEIFLNASLRVTRHFTPFVRIGNMLDETYQETLGYQALSRNAYGGLKIAW